MRDIHITVGSVDEALKDASRRFEIPEDAFDVLDSSPVTEDSGAEVAPGMQVRLKIKPDYLADVARGYVLGILKRMNIMAEVRVRPTPDFVHVDILSEQSSILIGRGGQTLDAIQHIVNRIVGGNEKNMPLILVDIENYRARRNRRLERIAKNAAREVRKMGRPVKLEPMLPAERKFIHKFLSDVNGVTTYSIGREGQRGVIIDIEKQPKSASVGDEELLPEILNDTGIYKRPRQLFQDPTPRNLHTNHSNDPDDIGELLDPGISDE